MKSAQSAFQIHKLSMYKALKVIHVCSTYFTKVNKKPVGLKSKIPENKLTSMRRQ